MFVLLRTPSCANYWVYFHKIGRDGASPGPPTGDAHISCGNIFIFCYTICIFGVVPVGARFKQFALRTATARLKPVYARFMRDVEGAVPYGCGRAMHAPTKAFNADVRCTPRWNAFNLILYGMMIGHLYNSSNDVEFG